MNTDTGTADVDSLGIRLRQLPVAGRVHLWSLHDDQGDVLWLSDGFMGPDEHSAVLQAYERFAGRDAPSVVVDDLGDGRFASVFRAESVGGVFLGAAMCVFDSKGLNAQTAAKQLRTPAIVAILEQFAALRAPAIAPPVLTRPVTVGPAGADRGLDTSATGIARQLDLRVPANQVSPEIDRLLAALRRTEIALHVQRIVPLQVVDGVRRFEVLMRSHAGADANSAPQKMLAQAAKAGLASMLDRRVVTTLLGWLVNNRAAWDGDPAVFSINLSATALRDEHFGRFLELCITKSGLPRGTLAFEVDEKACLAHTAGFVALATLLQRLGCPLAIDDFSGAARSLDLLRVRGVRMLKFSDTLTASIRHDELNRAAIAGLVQMARVLGMHTVAKRVNDLESRQALAAMGVGFVQSFSVSPPTPLDSIATDSAGAHASVNAP